MKRLATLLFLISVVLSTNAQDKSAQKVLDKLSAYYTGLASISIDFDMIVTYPEDDPVTYASTVLQWGNKFFFKNSEYEYYGNGDDIWIYDFSRNEVQINDFEEDEAEDYFITPLDLLNQYKSDNYEYQTAVEGREHTEIEFKPLDEFSDYSKFLIHVNKKKNEVDKIVAFGKDASRVTIEIKGHKENPSVSDQMFEFDKSKYPGVLIEDLRLD